MLLECRYNTFGMFNDRLRIGPAKWGHFDLIFVHDGHIVLWPDLRQRLELQTGQSVLLYPQTNFYGHSLVETTRVSVNHFAIVGSELPPVIKDFSAKSNGCESFLTAPSRQVERDIERLVELAQYPDKGPLQMEMMSAVMQLILLGLYEAQATAQPGVVGIFDELLRFMESNLDRNVSLEEMAGICGLSVSHFRSLFRKRFFQSPAAFFGRLRMAAAARKLRETTLPIKEIARQGGFDTLPNFYRAFATAYGMAPAEYRSMGMD